MCEEDKTIIAGLELKVKALTWDNQEMLKVIKILQKEVKRLRAIGKNKG